MASISRSVQFKGKENVLRAFEMKKVCSWSLWCSTQLLHSCHAKNMDEGLQELAAILDMYMIEPTPAVYTLRIHSPQSLKKTENHLSDRTPFDGSFNFQLVTDQQLHPSSNGDSAMLKMIYDKLTMQDERIRELEAEDEDGDDDAIGQIQRVMQIPGVSEVVGALVGGLFGKANAPQAIAGIASPVNEVEKLDEQKDGDQLYISESVVNSLAILMRNVPNFDEHLATLASASNKNPSGFLSKLKMALTFL